MDTITARIQIYRGIIVILIMVLLIMIAIDVGHAQTVKQIVPQQVATQAIQQSPEFRMIGRSILPP